MRRTFTLLLFIAIFVTALAITLALGFYTTGFIREHIEGDISTVQKALDVQFYEFNTVIEVEQIELAAELERFLPELAAKVKAEGLAIEDIPRERLEAWLEDYPISEIYLIDQTGEVVNTTFDPDLNFNLSLISTEMANFLQGIYSQGKVFRDRLTLSTQTGILNTYAYYGPQGEDYLVEVSVDMRDYLRRTRGEAYLDFLFQSSFVNAVQSNDLVSAIDMVMFNDLAAWSMTQEGTSMPLEVFRQLDEQPEMRIQEGDHLTVYTKFDPESFNLADVFQQGLASRVILDTSSIRISFLRTILLSILSLLIIVPFVYLLVNRSLQQRVIRPLDEVLQALERIKKGDYGQPVVRVGTEELRRISDAANQMQEEILKREEALRESQNSLEERISERTRELNLARQQAETLARTDTLTQLNNRRAFFDLATQMLSHVERYDHHFALFVLDIDYFKLVNDRFGHAVGDQALYRTGRVIEETVRATDVVARLGGEEFAVLLPETSIQDAMEVAQRLRLAISCIELEMPEGPCTFTASIGLTGGDGSLTLEQLLVQADKALYEAKDSGRNRVCVYQS